jgi:hypothetical protein
MPVQSSPEVREHDRVAQRELCPIPIAAVIAPLAARFSGVAAGVR